VSGVPPYDLRTPSTEVLESIILSIDNKGYYIPLTPEQEEEQRLAYNARHPGATIYRGPWNDALHQRYEDFLIDDVLTPIVRYPDGRLRKDLAYQLDAFRYFLARIPDLLDYHPSPLLADQIHRVAEAVRTWD